jgi:hypothetical protein
LVTACSRSSVDDQPGVLDVIGALTEPPQSVELSPFVLTVFPTAGALSDRNSCQEYTSRVAWLAVTGTSPARL